MQVRQTAGGLVEFIPSPQEKREGLVRDHVFALLANLHCRVRALEHAEGLSKAGAAAFDTLMTQIAREERECQALAEAGNTPEHPE